MIEIKTEGQTLDLPSGFSIEIEDSNPIFNERGSQSVPATVPASRRNCRLLAAPHRLDTDVAPNNPERTAEVVAGGYMRRGTMNVTDAGRSEGITFNVGFDNSTIYAKWSKRKLSELSNLPTYKAADQSAPLVNLCDELLRVYRSANPRTDDFAIFPLAVNNESVTQNEVETTYWEVLNTVDKSTGLRQPTKVKRVLDGEVTEVTVPEGYCISPFLRVWRVLELIFTDIGARILRNPFKEDMDLARLVVLNNAADSVCRGVIDYSDLMPDCTVEEFMNALWVRFGLVYNLNENTGTVTLELLRDIITKPAALAFDPMMTGHEIITYAAPQYVKLTAQTSIEGAAPANERFEDFVRGLDVTTVSQGDDVRSWALVGSGDSARWDHDLSMGDSWIDGDPDSDRDYPDPEPPEPDYDRDDDWGTYRAPSMRAATTAGDSTVTTSGKTFLAREFVTGDWFRLDAANNSTRASSSTFFNWDPQPEGLEAMELSSDDECVPIIRVKTTGLEAGNAIDAKCPGYLVGARHYHSYIVGSEDADNSGDSTPLAFLFAYTKDRETIGRISPEGNDGKPMKLDDGSTPTLSLVFQFADGLFAKFWAGYDELLRHGNRSVTVPMRMGKAELNRLNMFDVVTLRGIRCLIDTASYSLPGGREVPVEMKLRTVQPHGRYNIREEQNVPSFAVASRHLEWDLCVDGYGENGESLNTTEVIAAAVELFKQKTGYKEHGITGDYYYVSTAGAKYLSTSRTYPQWKADSKATIPRTPGGTITMRYAASVQYDIYETHDMTIQDGPEDWELSEVPIGSVSVQVWYSVILIARWVAD